MLTLQFRQEESLYHFQDSRVYSKVLMSNPFIMQHDTHHGGKEEEYPLVSAYLLGNHVADLRQKVLAEELIELPLSKGGPLSKTLSDLPPFFFRLAQEPPSALAWPLRPCKRQRWIHCTRDAIGTFYPVDSQLNLYLLSGLIHKSQGKKETYNFFKMVSIYSVFPVIIFTCNQKDA